jgi:hypothetical protein
MIIRRNVNRNFTTIPNDPIIDERLSFEALGLLTYLLSRPDNWRVCVQQLRTRGSIGRDKIYRLLKELMQRGYVIRRQPRHGESKEFGAYEYIVYDEPQKSLEKEPVPEDPDTAKTAEFEPLPEKPLPAEPYPANQDHNKDCKIINSLREHSASAEAGAAAPSLSAMIWNEALELFSISELKTLEGAASSASGFSKQLVMRPEKNCSESSKRRGAPEPMTPSPTLPRLSTKSARRLRGQRTLTWRSGRPWSPSLRKLAYGTGHGASLPARRAAECQPR